ncbi:MAG TPA: hypothetical protein VKX49_09105 [Bryobacteraceae bacterium]|jgi:uncharacterized Zn finger protein (UPF0148 family)|nr:hypothetical protein [Bryobacteraceae bacterium]
MKTGKSLQKSIRHTKPTAGKDVDQPARIMARSSTASYISQMACELAQLARAAQIPSLADMLTRAQIEAELWSRTQ